MKGIRPRAHVTLRVAMCVCAPPREREWGGGTGGVLVGGPHPNSLG